MIFLTKSSGKRAWWPMRLLTYYPLEKSPTDKPGLNMKFAFSHLRSRRVITWFVLTPCCWLVSSDSKPRYTVGFLRMPLPRNLEASRKCLYFHCICYLEDNNTVVVCIIAVFTSFGLSGGSTGMAGT